MACHSLRGRIGRFGQMLFFCIQGTSVLAGDPRLNQIQVIGSHNSYHIAPAPADTGLDRGR